VSWASAEEKERLSSSGYPELGQTTVCFPILESEYDHTVEQLEQSGMGDALRQDCRVDEVDSWYSIPRFSFMQTPSPFRTWCLHFLKKIPFSVDKDEAACSDLGSGLIQLGQKSLAWVMTHNLTHNRKFPGGDNGADRIWLLPNPEKRAPNGAESAL